MEKNNSSVKATNKNIRSSARKLSLVCNFIKGKKADIALRDLEFTRKRIAKDISKTVKSAEKFRKCLTFESNFPKRDNV